jgi:cation transport ATPase
MLNERLARQALMAIVLLGLTAGLAASFAGRSGVARWIWAAATIPVAASLAVSIIRDLLSGRAGVDAVAFVSMTAALALGETLAGAVIAVMYAGGGALEDFAVGRDERELKSLVDRAPRFAHRRAGDSFEDAPIDQVSVGDAILVRAGEILHVDGLITGSGALLDESALTGEPMPVSRRAGEAARSGVVNAGETFEMRLRRPRAKAPMQPSLASSRRRKPPRRHSSASRIATPCFSGLRRSRWLAPPGRFRTIRFARSPCSSPRRPVP